MAGRNRVRRSKHWRRAGIVVGIALVINAFNAVAAYAGWMWGG